MAEKQDYSPARLAHVAIFRAKDVKEGQEHKKIMYFWPRDPEQKDPEEERREELERQRQAEAESEASGAPQKSGAAMALEAARAARAAEEAMERRRESMKDARFVPLEDQCRIIGLCEGLVNFSALFEPNRPLEAIRTKQTTSVMINLDEEFWMQLCVFNPRMLSGSAAEQQKASEASKAKKDRGAPSGYAGVDDIAGDDVEWKEHDVDDGCLLEVAHQLSVSLRFFAGHSLGDLARLPAGEAGLKATITPLLDQLVPAITAARLSLFDSLDGMHFLPVDKNVYLQLQCFVSGLENSFPFVKSCTVLYADHLLWSGLTETEDLRSVYRYVTRFLSPWLREQGKYQARIEKELEAAGRDPGTVPRYSVPAPFLSDHTASPRDSNGWVIPDFSDAKERPFLPQVALVEGTARLCIYRLQNLICLLLLDDDEERNDPYSRAALQQLADVVVGECAFLLPSLEEHLLLKTQQQLAAAGASAADQIALVGDRLPVEPTSSDGSRFRYIYFNHMNLAVKSTVLQDWQTPYKLWRSNEKIVHERGNRGTQYTGRPLFTSGGVMLPRETVKVLHEMHSDFANVGWYEQQQRRTARDAEAADRLQVDPGPRQEVSEVLVRTAGDRWICGRQSEQREFFVVFDTKSSHLIEVAEDVRRLADQYFAHIFVDV